MRTSTPTPTTTKRPPYDPARAAYLKTRNAEVWVKGYVDKMNAWPAPKMARGATD